MDYFNTNIKRNKVYATSCVLRVTFVPVVVKKIPPTFLWFPKKHPRFSFTNFTSLMPEIRQLILFAVAIFFCAGLSAQRCPCSKNLDFTINKVEHNYAGFRDKVTDQTRASYQSHTDSLRTQAAVSTSDTACRRILYRWLRWFRDGHISMRPYGSSQMVTETLPPFACTELDSQTMLLTLPSMSNVYKTLVDSMLRANDAILRSKPFFIIDCRNNGGGSDNTWASIKPYLVTQAVVTDGRQYWASEDNAQFLLDMAGKKETNKKTGNTSNPLPLR